VGRMLCCLLIAVLPVLAAELRIGLGSSVITPPLDEPLAGYYYPRSADGVHDDLHARALVLESGGKQIVLVACETIGVTKEVVSEARRLIHEKHGIAPDRILISATHCHTGPQITPQYARFLSGRIADSVTTAMGRKIPARLFAATESEPSLPHYRRYIMKDGTVRTNPGFLNPDIVRPVGEIDPRVGALFFEDEQHRPLLTWVNYAMHLDTVGGTQISADYPYYMARLLESVRGRDMMTIFTIGAAGNINHWDVRRPGPQRGYETARRLGEVLASAVIKASTHQEPVSSPQLDAASRTVSLPLRTNTPQEVEEARKILAEPPPPNVDFTLDRVKATRVAAIEELGRKDLLEEVQVLAVGSIAFVGIPGELFVELGEQIQQRSPFPYTFVVELANDSIGYIPTRAAYGEGGYEPTSTKLAPGSGEKLMDAAVELLQKLHHP
jgi:neutral ceramidase